MGKDERLDEEFRTADDEIREKYLNLARAKNRLLQPNTFTITLYAASLWAKAGKPKYAFPGDSYWHE